jgi:hypothetical protein
MAVIDKPLRVVIDDGAVLFTPPLQNEWAELARLAELSVDQQIDLLVSKVVGVENFFYQAGQPVTAADVQAKLFPVTFYFALLKAWPHAVISAFRTEADAAKNG